MIKANEAKALSSQGEMKQRDTNCERIELEIRNAADQGFNQCYYSYYIDDIIIKELREAGYKVKRTRSDWGTDTFISWEA